jgi:hypothetical protein
MYIVYQIYNILPFTLWQGVKIMKQKLISRVFLFLLFFLTWLDITKFLTTPVSKISEPIPIFPQIQINLLKSTQQNLVNDALQETSKMLLRYFVPHLSNEPWQTDFVFVNLLPNDEPEVALALSLPPQKGILVILQKRTNYYFIASYQDHLFPITKLEVLPFKNKQDFLITKENQQEQDHLLNKSSPVKIWLWAENNLQETFTENTSWDITWQDIASETPKLYHLQQNLTITYCHTEEKIIIKTEGKQQFSKAPIKSTAFPLLYTYDCSTPFTILKLHPILQEYYWNDHWKKFILQTGFYLPPGEDTPQEIAILKDLTQHLKSLAFEEEHQYQVINKKKEVFPLNKNSLINLP